MTVSSEHTYRILSMDGGGIYGYTTALMLEALCNRDSKFLTDDPDYRISMFCGTSAGALNSLLLASVPDPREFVLGGGLRSFWHDPGIFTNDLNLFDQFWSWFGVTAWLGTEDFLRVLRNQFGDMRLGELHHDALILTWDWCGDAAIPKWRPRAFFNHRDEDRAALVVDVAYGAGSPQTLRAIRQGFGDAGVYAPNPSIVAYAHAKNSYNISPEENLPARRVALLSVGVGAGNSAFFMNSFNMGATTFGMVPTNPQMGNLYPPGVQLVLGAPEESETLVSKEILGRYYHRLNPPILNPPQAPPTMTACYLARFPQWQQYFLGMQEQAVAGQVAQEALDRTATFLASPYWMHGEGAVSIRTETDATVIEERIDVSMTDDRP